MIVLVLEIWKLQYYQAFLLLCQTIMQLQHASSCCTSMQEFTVVTAAATRSFIQTLVSIIHFLEDVKEQNEMTVGEILCIHLVEKEHQYVKTATHHTYIC